MRFARPSRLCSLTLATNESIVLFGLVRAFDFEGWGLRGYSSHEKQRGALGTMIVDELERVSKDQFPYFFSFQKLIYKFSKSGFSANRHTSPSPSNEENMTKSLEPTLHHTEKWPLCYPSSSV